MTAQDEYNFHRADKKKGTVGLLTVKTRIVFSSQQIDCSYMLLIFFVPFSSREVRFKEDHDQDCEIDGESEQAQLNLKPFTVHKNKTDLTVNHLMR